MMIKSTLVNYIKNTKAVSDFVQLFLFIAFFTIFIYIVDFQVFTGKSPSMSI